MEKKFNRSQLRAYIFAANTSYEGDIELRVSFGLVLNDNNDKELDIYYDIIESKGYSEEDQDDIRELVPSKFSEASENSYEFAYDDQNRPIAIRITEICEYLEDCSIKIMEIEHNYTIKYGK